jgi:hypothetical protein
VWGPSGEWIDVVARATHPCGASTEDLASCEQAERKKLTRHNMRATAFTRARNRAILALIGGGEVSGEELTAGGEIEPGEYISAGPMQPYQRIVTSPQTIEPQASTDYEAVQETNPVIVPASPSDWKKIMASVHAAAAEFGLDHDDLHALLGVDSLKDADPDDLRDLPGTLRLWADADRQAGVPGELSSLREDLESADDMPTLAAVWTQWAEQRKFWSRLSKLQAAKIKEACKAQLAQPPAEDTPAQTAEVAP